MKVLILGGGAVGGKLAQDLKEPFTLIESDISRVFELKGILSGKRVEFQILHGNGSKKRDLQRAGDHEFDVAVVLMNKDFINLHAVQALQELGVGRIIARVNNPKNMQKFTELGAEVFLHPIGYEENLIKTMLYPDINHAIHIFVRDGSPAEGRTIQELNLPKGCVISFILRGDEFIPPRSDTVIEKGDLIAADTVGKRAREIWKIFSKKGKAEQSGHILFPLTGEKSMFPLREVEILAKGLGSEVIFIVRPGKERLLKTAEGFISKRVGFRVITCSDTDSEALALHRKKIMIQKKNRNKMALESIMKEHMKERSPHIDLLAVPGPKSSRFHIPFLSTQLDYLILRAPMPVLVCRRQKPYRNILIYLHSQSALDVSYAIQIARATKANIRALYLPRNSKRAQYFRRFAEVYRVPLELKRIMGNPAVEFIREVKENGYDLVIHKKNIREFQGTQLNRLIHLWDGSLLVIP